MASDEPLTDKSAVKSKRGLDLSGTDWDTAIDAWIREASRHLTDAIGRSLHRVSGHTEKLGTRGSQSLYVRDHLPVVEVAEVTYDGETVDAADYELGAAPEGELLRKHGYCWHNTSYAAGWQGKRDDPRPPEKLYAVTYEGGYVTPVQAPFGPDSDARDLPWDIEGAIIEYCVMKYHQAGTDQTAVQEKLGDSSKKWATVDGRRVPHSFADVVDRYQKPRPH